jgi:hypothetical protein
MAAVPKRKPGPTLRAQWLGQQLRALRESTGMKLREAGEYLQRDPSMVSRIVSSSYEGLRTVFTVTPPGTASPRSMSSSRL